MVNGLGNLLSFVDTNVSSNNSPYNLNNYSYDDSFANMLNKTQTDYSTPSSVSNKIERHLNTEENYTENNYNNYDDYYNDYNQYDAEENTTIEENVSSSSENTAKKTEETSDNAEEAKSISSTEEQTENKSEELNASSNKDNNIEEKAEKLAEGNKEENVSAKEKLALTKEKAKLLLQNTSNDKKTDAKEVNTADTKENILAKADKKENTKNTEEIEKIKKQIESLNAEELSEEDKKELEDLIESLEALKAMIENDGSEDKKEVLAENTEENIEVKDIDNSEAKEIKAASIKDNDKNIETKDINDIGIEDTAMQIDNNAMADANIDMNIENKYADKKDAAEMKNNNSTVNNTISDDKGAELTIINMKDSAEGANLKGYNHYNNNVSKTHNSTNLTDNMIKFQDLMGKLVEKAQVAVNNGKSEVLMSLNPEYLGKVRLKISMDGDNLIGKIFVDNADVKDIFTKNLDTVITSLSEIGINIEGFDVMLRQDMPNDGGFGEELEAIGNRFASENNNNVEEVKADIKAYIVPERKLNLLI
ncbi:flagellar hook-length control protein [Brachyspira hyodysenteriae]|uniref:Flagellar hook-length control protein n=1 Tax=Brachyspira hyodysenteriae ATCC 27164 TaxID=1266923 RepID=A0A3B6VRT0_BRAHO|nr:flagellar hook-length control protein FliK [Brachyspira hyodysenteriae]ANN63454.1 flagellar hook-length control protein [Brachyspira hyodysenteriae ATCC 27164]KLI24513.1 flagellar hook-length control protein [Brachyspira hyodysenteriae]MCZ9925452.1 flagellar hook-length control protein FliK [Brachyspira hyodysenteriae]TVL76155.1 flagellar hook-length control protein [Brachyspira hyodysenteriae]TVL86388.1 flagellar hook-length control protein [Brachyspira hyodysenteriae]